MVKDPQEYLQEWEKEHNPFYPNEMRWDRIRVNTFLNAWKQQLDVEKLVCYDCNSVDDVQCYCLKCLEDRR